MIEHLQDWVLELDPTDEHDPDNYFSSNPDYSSEIYARVDGELAQVAYIPLVLTDSDHETIQKLEKEERKATNEYFNREKKPKKHWWQRAIAEIKDNSEWRAIHRQYDDTELVYKPRHSKELHDAHLHLVLSTPYMYKLLLEYKKTGQISMLEVIKVLDIAEGRETPHIVRTPKWKLRVEEIGKEPTVECT